LKSSHYKNLKIAASCHFPHSIRLGVHEDTKEEIYLCAQTIRLSKTSFNSMFLANKKEAQG